MSFLRTACAIVCSVVVLSSANFAQAQTIARKVHVLIYADTLDPTGNISNGSKANAEKLQTLFSDQVTYKFNGQITANGVQEPRTGADCTVAKLRADIAALDVQPTDTVLVYMCCHGGFQSGGQFIAMSGGPGGNNGQIRRSEIVSLIQARNPRQSVLITDSCANNDGSAGPAALESAAPKSKFLAGLLLFHSGTVSLNACSVGEFSWYYTTAGEGSVFTNAFVDACDTLSPKSDGSDWTWETLFNKTKGMIPPTTPAKTQTPAVF